MKGAVTFSMAADVEGARRVIVYRGEVEGAKAAVSGSLHINKGELAQRGDSRTECLHNYIKCMAASQCVHDSVTLLHTHWQAWGQWQRAQRAGKGRKAPS